MTVLGDDEGDGVLVVMETILAMVLKWPRCREY